MNSVQALCHNGMIAGYRAPHFDSSASDRPGSVLHRPGAPGDRNLHPAEGSSKVTAFDSETAISLHTPHSK